MNEDERREYQKVINDGANELKIIRGKLEGLMDRRTSVIKPVELQLPTPEELQNFIKGAPHKIKSKVCVPEEHSWMREGVYAQLEGLTGKFYQFNGERIKLLSDPIPQDDGGPIIRVKESEEFATMTGEYLTSFLQIKYIFPYKPTYDSDEKGSWEALEKILGERIREFPPSELDPIQSPLRTIK